MSKNYRFEILEFLLKQPDHSANLLPLIEKMANENVFSRLYFTIVIQSMKENSIINYEDFGDEIIAQLLPRGIAEYDRLKQYLSIIR